MGIKKRNLTSQTEYELVEAGISDYSNAAERKSHHLGKHLVITQNEIQGDLLFETSFSLVYRYPSCSVIVSGIPASFAWLRALLKYS